MLDLLPVSRLARLVPPTRGGKPVHPKTVIRWVTIGVSTSAGRLKLKATRLPGGWMATREDLDEFLRILTEASQGVPLPEPKHVITAASRRAVAELERMGL